MHKEIANEICNGTQGERRLKLKILSGGTAYRDAARRSELRVYAAETRGLAETRLKAELQTSYSG